MKEIASKIRRKHSLNLCNGHQFSSSKLYNYISSKNLVNISPNGTENASLPPHSTQLLLMGKKYRIPISNLVTTNKLDA
jgi:hypothetical protein